MRGAPLHLLAIATAHAANRQLGEGKDFSGLIQKDDIDYATLFLRKLHEAWDYLDSTFEQSQHVDAAMTYYQRIMEDFKACYTDDLQAFCVKYSKLVARYCQHPQRDGHYTSREFQQKILCELERRGIAKRDESQRSYWLFFKSN